MSRDKNKRLCLRKSEKNINDAIYVRPWMIEDSLKCAARRHKQNISRNQILDKEESEADKS